MSGTSIPGLQNLIDNITKQVETNANILAGNMANKFTGSNINALNNALSDAEKAENRVEIELLKHIALKSDDEKKIYYTNINTRKKDNILSDLQKKYDRKVAAINTSIDLLSILEGSPNVSAADYYRLKNKDITEKIADISGIELTNKRKAIYNLDYVNNMNKMKDRIYSIYVIMTLIYIVFFIRAKKYQSRLDILILISMILYPFLINYIMKYVLGILDYIFSLTPVNAYRNIYDNDINLSSSDDDAIYLHYSRIKA